jgi:threo-3-hydroxy-L-aspartate ammonia-lyase
MLLPASAVADAYARIACHINATPLLSSHTLDHQLGHRIVFKAEGFQKVGAFKARGALNTLLSLKEEGRLPASVCAYSSGNHAQAVAWAAKLLGVKATIFIPKNASAIKIQATRAYGADVVVTENRAAAEEGVKALVKQGVYLIPPYDHDMVIAGQGTAAFEALQGGAEPDAIFAPCGGGGLISGTWLAAQALRPEAQVFACEPLNANDAARSLRSGKIEAYTGTPDTLADGARTPSVSERTFAYLKQISGIYEISEAEMILWTQVLSHLLKVAVEPTSAMAMAGANAWLATQDGPRKVLIVLSGANISPETYAKVWAEDRLAAFF